MDWASNVGAGSGFISGGNMYGGGGRKGDLVRMENDVRVGLVGGEGDETGLVVDGSMCMKVMTDEQIELLRKQIAAYAVLCERIVEWHESFSAQQQSLPGMRLENLYCDPLLASGQKITTRQRWTPTSMQLQILENIFDQGTGTPSKQKIREITLALSQYGQISETNVYNWFQNRRARVKRKQAVKLPDNAELVVEAEVNSQREKKEGSAKHHACKHTPPRLDGLIHTPETCSDAHSANPETNKDDDDRKSSEELI